MLAGMLAARNVSGETHDVWSVNVEGDYHEEIRGEGRGAAAGDRQVPSATRARLVEDLLREAFARYDAVALGGAVGAVAAVGLLLATVVLLLRGGSVVGPNLSLLGNYLYGFDASWRGAGIGTLEAGAGGFVLGFLLGHSINWLVDRHEIAIRRRLEYAAVADPFGAVDP